MEGTTLAGFRWIRTGIRWIWTGFSCICVLNGVNGSQTCRSQPSLPVYPLFFYCLCLRHNARLIKSQHKRRTTLWRQYGTRNYKNKILHQILCTFVSSPQTTVWASLCRLWGHYNIKATALLWDVSCKCPCPFEQASGRCEGLVQWDQSDSSQSDASELKPTIELTEWGRSWRKHQHVWAITMLRMYPFIHFNLKPGNWPCSFLSGDRCLLLSEESPQCPASLIVH